LNPVAKGQNVTYTATVSPTPSGGSVSFVDDGAPISGCQSLFLVGANASCQANYSSTGAHIIVATYSGSPGFTGSASSSLSEIVSVTPCVAFANCNLSGLDLSGADLSGIDLTNANFNGANLTNADLSNANLTGANFNGANLTNASLNGAIVTGDTNFNKVIWSNTICPQGSSSNSFGGTCVGQAPATGRQGASLGQP
jgi:hypothetical protein